MKLNAAAVSILTQGAMGATWHKTEYKRKWRLNKHRNTEVPTIESCYAICESTISCKAIKWRAGAQKPCRTFKGNISGPCHKRDVCFDATKAPTATAPACTPTTCEWTQLGVEIDGEASDDRFGYSLAFSGDGATVAVGAPWNDGKGENAGHVSVYKWDGSSKNWTPKGTAIEGEAIRDYSGSSLAISDDGDILAVGALYNDGTATSAGHVRVYKWDVSTETWTQLGTDVDGEAEYDESGTSVALSGDGAILAVGAPYTAGTTRNEGHVRVYEWDVSTWTQLGADIDGGAECVMSGSSMSLSGDGNTLAVAARYSNNNAGRVRVYALDGATRTWTQLGADVVGEAEEDSTGTVALSKDGTILAVGSSNNGGTDGTTSGAGHVRVFKLDVSAKTWTQLGADIDGEAEYDYVGDSVSLSDDGATLAVGATGHGAAGQVRVYEFDDTIGNWIQFGNDVDGEAQYDGFGYCVALSGDGATLAVGAPGNDDSALGAGSVRMYEWTKKP